jgi:cold shock CspA family protein
MQGVVKSYDPVNRQGVILRDDPARTEYDLADDALVGSVFRMLRQGQRVVFDVTDGGLATSVRLGSEIDMATPDFTE